MLRNHQGSGSATVAGNSLLWTDKPDILWCFVQIYCCPNIDYVLKCVKRKWKTTKWHSCGQGLRGKIRKVTGFHARLAMELALAVGISYTPSPKIDRFVWKLLFLAAAILVRWRHDARTLGDHRQFASRAETELQAGARAKSISLSVRPAWASEN